MARVLKHFWGVNVRICRGLLDIQETRKKKYKNKIVFRFGLVN